MAIRVAGPLVGRRGVTFLLPDPGRRLARVWLFQELRRPRLGPVFRWTGRGGGTWVLTWRRGGVDRMEYLLRVEHPGGGVEVCPDPANPLRAEGAFGPKSVVEFGGYQAPAWLADHDHDHDHDGAPATPAVPGATGDEGGAPGVGPGGDGGRVGTLTTVELPDLGGDQPARVWRPAGTGADQPLPLLVVHDGPDYDRYAGLLRCLGWATSTGALPPLRAVLLPAPDRDERYSASPAYAAALTGAVLPALAGALPWPAETPPVGLGASLGALALLHAQLTGGAPFGGLYLQSGSFFLDPDRRVEGHLGRFERIRGFVDTVLAGDGAPAGGSPAPVVLTCGLVEENLAGNRRVAAALRRRGHPVTFAAGRDAHNWVAWRDTFEPTLVPFLRERWTGGGARR